MCRALDTGLVLVMFMTLSMILTLSLILSLVKYEACPVLFKNNTVRMILLKMIRIRAKVCLQYTNIDQKFSLLK